MATAFNFDYKEMVLEVLKENKDGTGVTYAQIQEQLKKAHGLEGDAQLMEALWELVDNGEIKSDTANVTAAKFTLPDDEKSESSASKNFLSGSSDRPPSHFTVYSYDLEPTPILVSLRDLFRRLIFCGSRNSGS
ncbi:unnamed protein product [Cyprideis torosa]|uniref:H15 domain-containing protein n=1 Tax=Cyprideis torosa TaxID=163714 RepID=A0A7R8WNM6_9CRUS|nr:unnamed protein product [Cyprideis torosa]CAG0906354.1 unnamed protein product [Cyprideis torosa]